MSDAPSARAAVRIVKHLAGAVGPVRAGTLARELGLPRATTYRLIAVLQSEGIVVHYPEQRAFGLSVGVYGLGMTGARIDRIRDLGAPLLAKLVKRVRAPAVASLGVLHGAEVGYVAQYRPRLAPEVVSAAGVRLPSHLTATGRSLLAHLPREQLQAVYPASEPLLRRNARGPRTVRELGAVLDRARRRGWADEDGEVTAGLGSVACAVLDDAGYPVAAIALTFDTEQIDDLRAAELAAGVVVSARAMEMRVQGRI